MSDPRDDGDLRRAFSALRDAERRRAPSLAALLARPARPRRRVPATGPTLTLAAAGLALAALALAVMLRVAPAGRDVPIAALSIPWQAPTDALLEMPSLETLYGEPSLELTSIELPELDTFDEPTGGT